MRLNFTNLQFSLFFFSIAELYKLTGEILGEGAYASVQTCINIFTDVECAVKIIDKIPGHARARVFREVETFHHCSGHPNILQLIEFFEDKEKFYLVFEKINGGPLLARIQENICFSEHDAAQIMKQIASGLNFLHKKGIAHRDLKPENILCVNTDTICPIKICDFDLGSGINFTTDVSESVATPQLLTPVSCIIIIHYLNVLHLTLTLFVLLSNLVSSPRRFAICRTRKSFYYMTFAIRAHFFFSW